MSDNGGRMSILRRISSAGLRTVDQISLTEMILPLVVIDVHAESARKS